GLVPKTSDGTAEAEFMVQVVKNILLSEGRRIRQERFDVEERSLLQSQLRHRENVMRNFAKLCKLEGWSYVERVFIPRSIREKAATICLETGMSPEGESRLAQLLRSPMLGAVKTVLDAIAKVSPDGSLSEALETIRKAKLNPSKSAMSGVKAVLEDENPPDM